MGIDKNFLEYSDYLKKRSTFAYYYRTFYLYPKIKKFVHGKVLDFGCGIGDFLSSCGTAVGVDINPELVCYCKACGKDARLMEGGVIPFENECFDSVVIDNVLEHLSYPEQTVVELYRILKVTGKLVVGVPGEKGYLKDKDHKKYYDSSALDELMGKYGFKLVKSFYVPFRSKWLEKRLNIYSLYSVFQKV